MSSLLSRYMYPFRDDGDEEFDPEDTMTLEKRYRHFNPRTSTIRLLMVSAAVVALIFFLVFEPRGGRTISYDDRFTPAQTRPDDARQDQQRPPAKAAEAPRPPLRLAETKTESSSFPELTPDTRPCNELPGANDVLLVIKTGATELHKKLPVHLKTTLKCVPDYLIFSDVEQEIEGVKVHDAIDHMKDMVDQGTDEWHFKEELERVRAEAASPADAAKRYRGMSHDEAWKLDKFKNLPMALKSYKTFPDKKWYVFIDADTAILWSTLLAWLAWFDHNKPYYMGSQVVIGDEEFAHGGSGYAISHEAARRLWDESTEAKRRHHRYAMDVCCGDQLLAHALRANGVSVYYAFPIIQGETPATVDFDEWHWCKPALTFHHMGARDIEDVWAWEQERRSAGHRAPTHEDVYDRFARPMIDTERGGESTRDGWQSVGDEWGEATRAPATKPDGSPAAAGGGGGGQPLTDSQRLAVASFEGCRERCLEKRRCMQFSWRKGECRTANAVRLGRPKPGWRSGWNVPRIDRWRAERAFCKTDWMLDRG